MFRNPRENDSPDCKTPIKPSTGRAPTPPSGRGKLQGKGSSPAQTTARRSSTKPLTPLPMAKSNVSTPASSDIKKAHGKAGTKPNHSILNFFKKVDLSRQDDAASDMFIADKRKRDQPVVTLMSRSASPEEIRFNESSEPVKRQRLSTSLECSPPPPAKPKVHQGQRNTENGHRKPQKRRLGPFLDDSDSEDGVNPSVAKKAFDHADQIQTRAVKAEKKETEIAIAKQPKDCQNIVETEGIDQQDISENKPIIPPLSNARQVIKEDLVKDLEIKSGIKREDPFDGFGDFGDPEDFQDDEYLEGEEFVERKWMEEQAMLEDVDGIGSMDALEQHDSIPNDTTMANCPICDATLGGITTDQASIHVNACLDGKPIPIPSPMKSEPPDSKPKPDRSTTRFSRASMPRPGQENPFEFGKANAASSSSAFSKLMSSKAEDTAWTNAAAAEHAARGKPASQRTCPFYKIMPGLFICVDAFRYGAVQGCNAYFLSHFHSDHYVGLSSTWCHGPIYCSKVTANLVKQQLRVDPKYVVALDFDAKVEVPGTEGVSVTMIPANHCPGSSLFLFEKAIGKGSNPKIQRILHCGDFRACPAHVAHPQLMPDIVDFITGKTKQQKIDVCYLDTTYLNPKYAFPSQSDVIQACADMCVSLKKDKAEESDAWEVVKRERAGAGMAKFVSGKASVKADGDGIATSLPAPPEATNGQHGRGRLLVICGTYSIGKERICLGIARALDCKIWAPPRKQRICAALEDAELAARMTDDPTEAQIHMQMLMEIRAETLQDYLNGYKPHFSRIVGFRPSGWNYKPPTSRFVDSPSVHTVLHSDNWRSRYSMAELVPQRGSTREASCFGVPYSEHSSFRELTMFCCALRIEKVVPTVNVGSAAGRAKMKAWIDRWLTERRKNGVVKIGDGAGEVKW